MLWMERIFQKMIRVKKKLNLQRSHHYQKGQPVTEPAQYRTGLHAGLQVQLELEALARHDLVRHLVLLGLA